MNLKTTEGLDAPTQGKPHGPKYYNMKTKEHVKNFKKQPTGRRWKGKKKPGPNLWRPHLLAQVQVATQALNANAKKAPGMPCQGL